MIDSTNPRILADNIRALSDKQIAEAAEILALQGDVEALGSYSEDEVDTGKKWIDNSTIYRRVISGTTGDTLNAITTAISTAEMGITNVTQMDIYIKAGDYYSPMGNGFVAYYLYGSSAIAPGVRCKVTTEAYLSSDIIAIIEYTKTAPSPAPDLSPAPDDVRSIEPEEIPEDEYIEPEVVKEAPEEEVIIEEPIQEVKKTTRKKSTN